MATVDSCYAFYRSRTFDVVWRVLLSATVCLCHAKLKDCDGGVFCRFFEVTRPVLKREKLAQNSCIFWLQAKIYWHAHMRRIQHATSSPTQSTYLILYNLDTMTTTNGHDENNVPRQGGTTVLSSDWPGTHQALHHPKNIVPRDWTRVTWVFLSLYLVT